MSKVVLQYTLKCFDSCSDNFGILRAYVSKYTTCLLWRNLYTAVLVSTEALHVICKHITKYIVFSMQSGIFFSLCCPPPLWFNHMLHKINIYTLSIITHSFSTTVNSNSRTTNFMCMLWGHVSVMDTDLNNWQSVYVFNQIHKRYLPVIKWHWYHALNSCTIFRPISVNTKWMIAAVFNSASLHSFLLVNSHPLHIYSL